MRISTLSRKWNISEQIIKSFLKEQDNNFDMSADEISEKQHESLIMHFGNEVLIDKSKGIVCYSFQVNRVTQSYIVRKKDGKYLDVDGNKMFTSIIASRKTQPVMLTLNHYNLQGGYNRGIVSITEEGTFEIVCPFSHEYDFIDGVDHGLARVRQNNKWGIIGYNGKTKKFEKELPVEYDSIWNFFDKNISIVNAEKDRKSSRLSLRSLAGYQSGEAHKHTEEPQTPKGISYFSVSNFKRFKGEVSFDLGGINFIVGPNNAGKSTMGKALMLAYYNLMYYVSFPASGSEMPKFDLSPKNYDGLTFETIKSAFCNKQDADRYMTFTLIVNGCKSTMKVFCKEDEQSQSLSYAEIHSWEIEDEQTEVSCRFDFQNNKASLCDRDGEIYSYEQKAFWNTDTSNTSDPRLIDSLVDSFEKILEEEQRSLDIAGEKFNVKEEIQRNANEIVKVQQCLTEKQKSFFKDSFLTLYRRPEFIYSNSGVSRILDSDDNNNHIAQIARDYYFMTKTDVGKENALMVQKILADLVIKYLSDDYFKIGKDIEVEEDEDSYYKIFIKKSDSEKENLANYGRGTIQVVLLLMKIAVEVFKSARDNSVTQSIVLVEEPEQNMHPAWQAILAQLFVAAHTLHQKLTTNVQSGLMFLIETHSEYMVRKSQVLVAKLMKEQSQFTIEDINHLFSVKYVSINGNIYDLEYKSSGIFVRDFEPGFFNVSNDSAMDLFDLNN